MMRPFIATGGAAGIGFAMLFTLLLGFVFAAGAHIDPGAPLPPHAIRPTPGLLQALQPADHTALPLIRVAFRRPDSDTLANALLGFLVWLPFTASLLAARLQYHLAILQYHLRLDASEVPGARRKTNLITFALFILAMLWSLTDDSTVGLFLLIAILCALLVIAVTRPLLPNRVLLIAVLAFMVAGIAASVTSHRLYTAYHGLVPVPFSDRNGETKVISELQRDINATVPTTAEDVFDRIDRLPSLNAWGSGIALFAKNRIATKTLVVSALFYLVMFACHLQRVKASHEISTGFLIAYALTFYVTVGASFGLLYFNDVMSAAGRQNVLCILADSAAMPSAQYNRLKEQFSRFGWTRQLERAIEEVRSTGTPRANEVLRAALAEHWSNSVIAQAPPQSAPASGSQLRQDRGPFANQTLADMFYFSFASFTTTGYGDLRPVSDSARFWSIIENIAELLFTAIFFVVVLAERGGSDEHPNLDGAPPGQSLKTGVKALTLPCIAMLFLAGCSTFGEQPVATFDLKGAPDEFCPQVPPLSEVAVHVIIDDSGSMQGFVLADRSTYTTHLEALLGALGASARVTFRRLSDPGKPIPPEDVYSKDFYDQPDTPLSTVFNFAQEERDLNIAIVVISDFQQDEGGGIQSLTDAVGNAMTKRPFVTLSGWRTNYQKKELLIDDRSWYAMIMANSAEGLSLVERASDILAESFERQFFEIDMERTQGPQIFRSRSFTRVEPLQWISEESSDLQWQPTIASQPVSCRGSEQAIQFSGFVQRTPRGGSLRFRSALTTEIPLAEVAYMEITIRRLSRDQSGARTLSDVAPTQTTYVEVHRGAPLVDAWKSRSDDANSPSGSPPEHAADAVDVNETAPSRLQTIPLEIVYSLPLDNKESAYVVEFRTGRFNLSCPRWVDEWSTPNPREWRKTLNLKNIVKTIIESSSRNEPVLIHYLFLAKAPAS